MSNELTDRELWEKYWKSYRICIIPRNPVYKSYIPPVNKQASFIEIGGFPGLNAAYFYKHVCEHVSLLDFYVDETIIRQVEQVNDIPANTIRHIEADFFSFEDKNRYDIVFSHGFIEHFEDTRDVIKRHYCLLNENGNLLIVLPNFRGLNGAIQYIFDRKNFSIHNLNSMYIPHLKDICRELNLKNVVVEYTRKPMVWIEPQPTILNKIGRVLIKMLSYAIKLVPVRGRFLSPYIVISGNK